MHNFILLFCQYIRHCSFVNYSLFKLLQKKMLKFHLNLTYFRCEGQKAKTKSRSQQNFKERDVNNDFQLFAIRLLRIRV